MANPIVKLQHKGYDFSPGTYITNYLTVRQGVDTSVTRDTITLQRQKNEPIPAQYALFGGDGIANPDQMIRAIEFARANKGPIWELIISVTEDDCMRYGIGKNEFEVFLRANLVKCLMKLGLSSIIIWCAVVHKAVANSREKHPHVHVLFWLSGAQLHKSPFFPLEKLNAMRTSVIKEILRLFARKANIKITDAQLDYCVDHNLPIESVLQPVQSNDLAIA